MPTHAPPATSVEDILGKLAVFASQPLNEQLAAEFGITRSDTTPGHQQPQVTYTWHQSVDTRQHTTVLKQQRLRASYGDYDQVQRVDLDIWIMDYDPAAPERHIFGLGKDRQIEHSVLRGGHWRKPTPSEDLPNAYRYRISQCVPWLFLEPNDLRPVLRSI